MRNLRAEINGDHHKWFWSVHFLPSAVSPKTLAVELPAPPPSPSPSGKTIEWWLWLASGSLLPASPSALSTSLRRRRSSSSNPLFLDPHRLVLDLDWFLQRGCDDSYTRFHFCFRDYHASVVRSLAETHTGACLRGDLLMACFLACRFLFQSCMDFISISISDGWYGN